MIEVTIAARPVATPDARDLPDVERHLSWGLFLQGRLGDWPGWLPPTTRPPC